MKTRNVVLVAILSASLQAQAGYVESAERAHELSKEVVAVLIEIKREAETAVSGWMAAISERLNGKDSSVENKAAAKPTIPTNRSIASVPSAPLAPSIEKQNYSQIIDHAKAQVAGQEAVTVASPGRAGTSDLSKTAAGVPTIGLSKSEKNQKAGLDIVVKAIPRLDIGVERTIKKTDFTVLDKKVALELPAKPKALPTPELVAQKEVTALTKVPVAVVAKAEPPKRGDFQLGQIVTQKKVDDISLMFAETRPLSELKDFKNISDDELLMLSGTLLYEKKTKCHMVAGLLNELANKPAFSEESNFYLGMCAHKMGFHSEAVTRLLRVLRAESPEFARESLTSLVEDLPRDHDQEVVEVIKNLKNKNFVADEARDSMNFIMARNAHAHEAWGEAVSSAGSVSEKSKHYADSRYYLGVAQFAQKKEKEAEKTLLELRAWLQKKGGANSNLEALVAINLGRILFMQERFQAAHDEYMKVPKDHPLWVQALIEEGWTQLSLDDAAGAIGNMYSLHSPYFKSVFMPESWVVRTIGYIDICQYGDAYRTLSRMELMHNNELIKVQNYMAASKEPLKYYSTVRNYIKANKSDVDVDGLPAQVIREIARQRGFLNAQNALNDLEDETAQYGLVYNIIKADQVDNSVKLKRTRDRLAKTKFDLANIKKHPDQERFLNEWSALKRNDEQLVLTYVYLEGLYEKARLGYLTMKSIGIARIDKEKDKLKVEAGHQLALHLKDVKKRLEQISEGNEFLRYEIFAGSGENIRYQVAGGATGETKRIPANIKPQKILNWEFDGEYWEDEIGSYRSALKNNCPNSNRSRAALEGAAKTTASRDN